MGLSSAQQLLLPVKFHTPLKMGRRTNRRLSDDASIPCTSRFYSNSSPVLISADEFFNCFLKCY